ncbi:MAG: anthranilate phosphoribosyltransferase [Dehalococcoidia bacterium]|nr:anthranilate phosphoribosyltransferase [Dehalococcoidia bacterium]
MVMQDAIKALVDGYGLTPDLARGAMGEIMTGAATPAQVGAFLASLRVRGETPEVIAACAEVMQSYADPVPAPDVIDICGTGGDGIDTVNVSTAAGIVVAAAGGRVAKHGNRAMSSRCGSADVLEALGARLDLDGEQVARAIDACGFAFLFAQRFHPAMKHVAGARREMGVRTVFNMLGPLTNPAGPRGQLAGVGAKHLAPLMAQAFALRGMKRAMVVHSADGLDEISPAGVTYAWLVDDGVVTERELRPADFGLPEHPLSSVAGGEPSENARALVDVFAGAEGPVTDFVLANSAAACFVAGLAPDLRSGTDVARKAIASGRAREVLERYISVTQELAGE